MYNSLIVMPNDETTANTRNRVSKRNGAKTHSTGESTSTSSLFGGALGSEITPIFSLTEMASPDCLKNWNSPARAERTLRNSASSRRSSHRLSYQVERGKNVDFSSGGKSVFNMPRKFRMRYAPSTPAKRRVRQRTGEVSALANFDRVLIEAHRFTAFEHDDLLAYSVTSSTAIALIARAARLSWQPSSAAN